MKQIYKITYPTNKIYIGKDSIGSYRYFGSPDMDIVNDDFDNLSLELRKDYTIRKQILWESEDCSESELSSKEIEFIRMYDSNNPKIGYNRWPKYVPMNILTINEDIIVGKWLDNGTEVLADENCKRIDWLTSEVLHAVGVDESGWQYLYQDPNDKRFWILSYPHSELHGGGPPTLKLVSSNEDILGFTEVENT